MAAEPQVPAPPDVLYHGTTAVLAEHVAREGLRPRRGVVDLATTRGLAWAFGVWATGLTVASGITRPLPALSASLKLIPSEADRVGRMVAQAIDKGGPNFAAVCEVDANGLELEPVYSRCPVLPWEEKARRGPAYRSTEPIAPRRIKQWFLYRVPELEGDQVIAGMAKRSHRLAHEFPVDAPPVSRRPKGSKARRLRAWEAIYRERMAGGPDGRAVAVESIQNVARLAVSIEDNGYDDDYPVTVTEGGEVVDGRHRLAACHLLGVSPSKRIVADPGRRFDTDALAIMSAAADGLVEDDVLPAAIGRAIPNGRLLVREMLQATANAALYWHGPAHACRVAANGLELIDENVDAAVVLLYALFHDVARRCDGDDHGHGTRAAKIVRDLNGGPFDLSPERLRLLADACARHSGPQTTRHPTIGACWDADRLDTFRYGHEVEPKYMSTRLGRELARGRRPPAPALEDVLADYRELA